MWALDQHSFFFFSMICNCSSTISRKDYLFSIDMAMNICQKPIDQRCVNLFLDSIFGYIDLSIFIITSLSCFCSFVKPLEVSIYMFSIFFFFLFCCSKSFYFSFEFRISLPISHNKNKRLLKFLIGIAFYLLGKLTSDNIKSSDPWIPYSFQSIFLFILHFFLSSV